MRIAAPWQRIPRRWQPVAQGLLGVPGFALAHGVVTHSGTDALMPWGRILVPWILIGVMHSEVTQRFIGGGRLDNRVTVRLLVADVLFFLVLAPTGLIFLFPVAMALAAMMYVPHAGSRTWVRAAALAAVLHVVVQLELEAGMIPLIMPMATAHYALFASFGLALLMMANTGMLTRNREVADAALAAEQDRRHRDLLWAATHDGLTGLRNRSGLEPALEAACAGVAPGTGIGVVFMDLDGFKVVNDSEGHAVGDELLQAVAHRLSGVTRTGDVLARVGGDEFVALLTGLASEAPLTAYGERAQSLVDEPFELSTTRARISVSVGSAFTDEPGVAVELLLRAADAAMYQHKRSRPGRPARPAQAVATSA